MATTTFNLGIYREAADQALSEITEANIVQRIWDGDHTVWKDEPTEITNRLGWLRIMEMMREPDSLERMKTLAEAVKRDGITHVLLLGMGGSSLAPEVFSLTFGSADGHPALNVLDSTDPGAVLNYARQFNPTKTLFIVATKSGGTAETLSFFKYFYNRTLDAVGADKVGDHFVAITDPGSKLVTIAEKYHFRATFLNDPNIGGRYSALSYFGLVPAALLGVDVDMLTRRAVDAAEAHHKADSPAVRIGAVMGKMVEGERDKITFITSPAIRSFGDWVEQLIAESTGKEGKGILPVVGEPVGVPAVYRNDRLFVYLKLGDDSTHDAAVDALQAAGHPVIRIVLDDRYDLGEQFFVWELATVISGHRLGINPFDQPNVESAKVLARQMIATYQESGKLPAIDAALSADGITVYGDVSADTPAEALNAFLQGATDGAYIAIQAYITPTPEADTALADLRLKLRDATRYATSVGYGPRFLHSTGQLHKGDGGNGLFIQFTSSASEDAAIPDEAGQTPSAMSFDTLKQAQMLGDRQALVEAGRKVITLDLGDDVVGGLQTLTRHLS